jgi:hypothetical protein
MKIGDYVRFLHSKEAGYISKIIDDKTIEVEIEEGFRLPILKKEVALVAAPEKSQSIDQTDLEMFLPEKQKQRSEVFSLLFKPFNDKLYKVHLWNDTSIPYYLVIYQATQSGYKLSYQGTLQSDEHPIVDELNVEKFEQFPKLIFQFLPVFTFGLEMPKPLVYQIQLKAATFYKNKKQHAQLGEVHVLPLQTSTLKIDSNIIGSALEQTSNEPSIEKPNHETDLHIESIEPRWKEIESSSYLNIQLHYFKKILEAAIVHQMSEITFIHGVGNYILKNEIHRLLSKNKQVEFYKEAQKNKFGYGATLVKLK